MLFSNQLEEDNVQVITSIVINRTMTLVISFDLGAKGEINVICSPDASLDVEFPQNTFLKQWCPHHFPFTFLKDQGALM